MDQNNLKEFRRGHSEDASYEVSSQLAKWLGRSCLNQKSLWTDGRKMHDGQFASRAKKENLLVLGNFFFCSHVYKKLSTAEASKSVFMWERVKSVN